MRRRMTHSLLQALVTAAVLAGAASLQAQQVTGEPGSPGATTTISGNRLPAPDPKFGGVIKDDALQSKAWWAPRIVPPKTAPNILLIMTDDSGFGVPEHVRRRHPDADDGSRREDRPALQ